MFNDLMHIAFYTEKMDEMVDFYTNKLGGEVISLVRYSTYLNRDDRPKLQEVAKIMPNEIFNIYIKLAPNQFIEFFKADPKMKDHNKTMNEQKGYSHFALTVDDI